MGYYFSSCVLMAGLSAVNAKADTNTAVQNLRIKLVSYNVENLFDYLHDADATLPHGKEDFTFLALGDPLKDFCSGSGFYLKQCEDTDWTREHATWKLENVAKSLSYITKKPDIITLAEVENDRVVGAIAEKLGYGSAHITSNSPDHRGIDVGIIYNKDKLKMVESVEIVLTGSDLVKATRNILRAKFQLKDAAGRVLPNHTLYVYANHWPSQAAPATARMVAAKALQANIEEVRASLSADVRATTYFAAMGDFNTVNEDSPHPFNDFLVNTHAWEGALVDTEVYARKEVPALENTLLPGSYWYSGDKNWNKLDRIFVSQNLVDKTGADVVPSTFNIYGDHKVMQQVTPTSGPYANQSIWIPRRFETTATTQAAMGFSDHLPIGVELNIPVR
jgi:endonuclease/exonuclease/phosphatase family metal-dependent hydrolase